MGRQNKLTEVELSFIENSFPQLSCAEIAKKMNRTKRCVEKAVNRLGLREAGANTAPARAREDGGCDGPDGFQDELSDLKEVRKALRRSIKQDAGPQTLPKLSAELREVLKRISEIEEGGADGSGGSLAGGAGNITLTVPLRPA